VRKGPTVPGSAPAGCTGGFDRLDAVLPRPGIGLGWGSGGTACADDLPGALQDFPACWCFDAMAQPASLAERPWDGGHPPWLQQRRGADLADPQRPRVDLTRSHPNIVRMSSAPTGDERTPRAGGGRAP